MVRIRMNRFGRPHLPFYRINAVDKRTKRDGKVLENLGWYDPKAADPAKKVHLEIERIKDWLARGAQPSDTVMDLLAAQGVVDAEQWKSARAKRIEAAKTNRPAAGESEKKKK